MRVRLWLSNKTCSPKLETNYFQFFSALLRRTSFTREGHDFQALLTKIWWGSLTTDTAISKLVVAFFWPPLIWTNLIKFR